MELTATSRDSRAQTAGQSKARKIIIGHERRILLLTLLAGVPALLVAMILLWSGNYTSKVQWTLTIAVVAIWWGVSFGVRRRVVLPLQTLSNLLAALREEDYSVRARGSNTRPDDALWEVMVEVNALSETLREQRLGALEATALLRKVMAEINVAVFTFDSEHRLQLVNRAGERLLAQPAERLLGQSAADLGLDDCLNGDPSHTVQRTFPGVPTSNSRWR